MNLVDAIRRAANESGTDRTSVVGLVMEPTGLGTEAPAAPAPAPQDLAEVTPPVSGQEPVEVASPASCPTAEPRPPVEKAGESDDGTGVHLPGSVGNLVRIELFLGPEQLHAMLRGAFSGHRSVMTLRETAHYLRLTTGTVERLAGEGTLPAFRVEGHWRFLKAAVDDWAATRTTDWSEGKENRDAA